MSPDPNAATRTVPRSFFGGWILAGALLLVQVGANEIQGATPRMQTIAGTGTMGWTGDGGPALEAQLNNPFGVVKGPEGALFVCEYGGAVVRRIDPAGRITTVVGSGRTGSGGDGALAAEAEFNQPHEIRFDRDGNLFIADMLNHRIRRVDSRTHRVSTVAGTGRPGYRGDGGSASDADLNNPISIQFDPQGDLFLCDIGNHRIRKVDMKTGVIVTVAGTGERAPTIDGAPYATAPLNGPRSLDFDHRGDLWVVLREGNQVWRLESKTGLARHVAGTGRPGNTGNGGPASRATLSGPKGIALAPNGDVYLADTESHTIRRIESRTGNIDVVAGIGSKEDGREEDPTRCALARPHGVFVDRDGTVYIGDSENHRVRRLRQ